MSALNLPCLAVVLISTRLLLCGGKDIMFNLHSAASHLSSNLNDACGSANAYSDNTGGSCSTSRFDTAERDGGYSFYYIDLVETYQITKVMVDAGLGAGFMSNVSIWIGSNSFYRNIEGFSKENEKCWMHDGMMHPDNMLGGACPTTLTGSKVTIYNGGSMSPVYVCNIKIYGMVDMDCWGTSKRVNCYNNCTCQDVKPDACDSETGKCEKCGTRRMGTSCQTTCEDGMFLVDGKCTGKCHCNQNQYCEVGTGRCVRTGCKQPWSGDFCQTNSNKTEEGGQQTSSNTGAIVGAVVGVLIVGAAAGGAVFYLRRQKKPEEGAGKKPASIPVTSAAGGAANTATSGKAPA